jgi:hypothetical protein
VLFSQSAILVCTKNEYSDNVQAQHFFWFCETLEIGFCGPFEIDFANRFRQTDVQYEKSRDNYAILAI